jgi:hypothetical protein
MTAPITLLKFWGRPMLYNAGRFWISFPELRLAISIYEKTPTSHCYWSISESGGILAVAVASGPKAARTAAQKWLADRARKTLEMSTKGRAA